GNSESRTRREQLLRGPGRSPILIPRERERGLLPQRSREAGRINRGPHRLEARERARRVWRSCDQLDRSDGTGCEVLRDPRHVDFLPVAGVLYVRHGRGACNAPFSSRWREMVEHRTRTLARGTSPRYRAEADADPVDVMPSGARMSRGSSVQRWAPPLTLAIA